jgi:hypothetical protein
MDILTKSDAEILQIAEPIWDDIVKGANDKNWHLFSKHMPEDEINTQNKKDIDQQWQQQPVLSSLSTSKEFVGILKRKNAVTVLWKHLSTADKGEYLGMLNLQTINSEVKSVGMFVT